MIKFISKRDYSSIIGEGMQLSSLEELLEWRKGRAIVFVDTETNTLNYRTGLKLLTQIGDEDTQFVIDHTITIPNEFWEDITVCCHNVVFDYNQMKRDGVIFKNTFDTQVAEQLLTEGLYDGDYVKMVHPYSLETLVYVHFSHQLDKTVRMGFINYNHDSIFTPSDIEYSADDVKWLAKLYKIQYDKLEQADLLDCMNLIENPYTMASGDMQYHGIYMDRVKWVELEARKKVELIDYKFTVDECLIEDLPIAKKKFENPKFYQQSLFPTERVRMLTTNYNSAPQVSHIFDMLGLKIVNKDNKETTSIKELKKLNSRSKFLDGYIKLKEAEKQVSSFGSNWLPFIDPFTGRIHTSINQILETGRTASYKPNLYQVPRDPEYRSCFMVQNPDDFYVGGDYSAQEGKVMADKANDYDYIKFFNTGDGDAHSFVASKMFSAKYGRDVRVTSKQIAIELKSKGEEKEIGELFLKESKLKKTKEWKVIDGYIVIDLSENNDWRQRGKTLNFFLSFGGSAYTLSNDLKITMAEADALVKAFFDGFPTLKAMFDREKHFAIQHGYTVTNQITKRRRWYPEWEEMSNTYRWLNDQKTQLGRNYWAVIKDKSSLVAKENKKAFVIKGSIEREAMNTPIQGTAADMTKLAFIYARNKIMELGELPFANCGIRPILMPHDEIVLESSSERVQAAQLILADSMEEAGKMFVKSINLRPKIETTKYWKK